jgi:GDP-L-fucose synthase
VRRFLFLGSSCIYPKNASQPIKEEELLNGYLEKTNESYAIAKIAGIKLCEALRKQYEFDAISLMPTNLYGPNDNYHIFNSHVLPSLIRKFSVAKRDNLSSVTCWGSGSVFREFLHVDDLAEAAIFCLENWFPTDIDSPKDINGNPLYLLNVGTGKEISIKELAKKISEIVKFDGRIFWDKNMPDGNPRKVLDISRLKKLGWKPKITLNSGLVKTINDLDISNF